MAQAELTFWRLRRLSQVRSSGEAFMAFGKMRPLEPGEGIWRRACWPTRSKRTAEGFQRRSQMRGRGAVAGEEPFEVFGMREVEAAAARHQELAADDGMRSYTVTANAARAQRLRRHQACWPRADHCRRLRHGLFVMDRICPTLPFATTVA